MQTLPLRYLGYTIFLQEVPNEISLGINISGCPYKCKGCHSQYLWEYKGNYISDDIDELLKKYDGYITCVCFMGGDQNQEELYKLLTKVKNKNLNTCLYTGAEISDLKTSTLSKLDYLKTGKYIEELGGLNNPNTNQKMYNFKTGKMIEFYKGDNIE